MKIKSLTIGILGLFASLNAAYAGQTLECFTLGQPNNGSTIAVRLSQSCAGIIATVAEVSMFHETIVSPVKELETIRVSESLGCGTGYNGDNFHYISFGNGAGTIDAVIDGKSLQGDTYQATDINSGFCNPEGSP